MKGKNGVEDVDILKFKTIIDLLSNIFIVCTYFILIGQLT